MNMYNATQRPIHANIGAVKAICNTHCVCARARVCVCVCVCMSLVIQHAMRMRHIVISDCPAVQYFSILSHTRHDFLKKFTELLSCCLTPKFTVHCSFLCQPFKVVSKVNTQVKLGCNPAQFRFTQNCNLDISPYLCCSQLVSLFAHRSYFAIQEYFQ
jgi:hypothetical protein